MPDDSSSLALRFRAIAKFLPAMKAPDFKFADLISRPSEFPFYDYSPTARAFIRAANDNGWVLGHFDWPSWKDTPEANMLRDDPNALKNATPEQLAKLLTVLIRQERFCDGVLNSAFKSGLLTGILERVAVLLEESIS